MPDDVAYLLGQHGEQLVATTGWIGEHPADGRDVAHLLIYPTGHGVAEKMRTFASGIGLAPALAGPPVAADAVHLIIDHETHGAHVQMRDGGETLILERPVTDEWVAAARSRGYVMVTVGQDGYSGRPAEFESYLARAKRLFMGLISIRAADRPDASG